MQHPTRAFNAKGRSRRADKWIRKLLLMRSPRAGNQTTIFVADALAEKGQEIPTTGMKPRQLMAASPSACGPPHKMPADNIIFAVFAGKRAAKLYVSPRFPSQQFTFSQLSREILRCASVPVHCLFPRASTRFRLIICISGIFVAASNEPQ